MTNEKKEVISDQFKRKARCIATETKKQQYVVTENRNEITNIQMYPLVLMTFKDVRMCQGGIYRKAGWTGIPYQQKSRDLQRGKCQCNISNVTVTE